MHAIIRRVSTINKRNNTFSTLIKEIAPNRGAHLDEIITYYRWCAFRVENNRNQAAYK